MLEVKGVYKQYKDKKIGEFNFKAYNDQIIAILGPSGAGKSTFVKLITGVLASDGGSILFEGRELVKDDFTYISQVGTLFNHLIVRDNLSLTEVINMDDIEEVFKILRLDISYLDKYPFELSGGEKQRIDLVRAIISKSKIIILDEAFSALDFKTKWNIYELLNEIRIKYGLLVILITHDIEEAIYLGDKIVVIDEGKIIFHALSEEFLNADSAMFGNLISEKQMNMLKRGNKNV